MNTNQHPASFVIRAARALRSRQCRWLLLCTLSGALLLSCPRFSYADDTSVTGDLSVSGSTSLFGNLTLSGTADFLGSNLLFGIIANPSNWNDGLPGVSTTYSDGSPSSLTFLANRDSHHWIWNRMTADGSAPVPMMTLDSSHNLNLFSPNNSTSPAIVLNPAQGQILINGQPLSLGLGGWTTSSSDLTFLSGYVGIGTSSPTAALDVGGTVKFNLDGSSSFASGACSITSNGWLGIGTATPNAPMVLATTSGPALANFNFTGNDEGCYQSNYSGQFFYNDEFLEGGLMALGKTYPCSLFNGNVLFRPDQLFLWSVGRNGILIATRQPSDTGTAWRQDGLGDTAGPIVFATGGYMSYYERMRITPEGNVGVGTNTPQASFEVQGTARFSGPVHIEPQGDLTMGDFTADPGGEEQSGMQRPAMSRAMGNGPAMMSGTNGVLDSGTTGYFQ